ncbi:hypothetical protein LWI28_013421 [Acer negundo]|uniref:Protein kinase domain-containing protein n=1 Tax=Acer negundo TaxID=4023 RepID=A0AAD5NX91_ACENE|nr:hypothetical protein LWI28_013421 [Acer negundo]
MSICSSIILLFLLSPYSESKSNYGVNQTAYEFWSNPTLPSLTNITYEFCQPTTCGRKGPVIRFPFRLKTQPVFCGLEGFELSCSNNNTLLHLPYISSSTSDFYVQEISYLHSRIAITDPNETTCPVKTLFSLNFTSLKSPFLKIPYRDWQIVILNCTEKIEHSSRQLAEVGPIDCISDDKNFVYVIRGDAYIENCSILSGTKRIPHLKNTVTDFLKTRRMEMEWEALGGCHRCEKSGNFCGFNFTNNSTICVGNKDPLPISVIIGTSIGVTIFFTLVILLIYKSKKSDKEKEVQQRVEKFLEDYKTHNPTRYTYSDIKKITGKFKHKLGQGGYGSVYKGKLSNGIPVAVKILEHSKANGEDFINEVAIISRIHHFNVVRLLGFCSEGTRPARGTVGYIAPELFSRNFGEVSYKADVFSYGMMLLEMVGCRKNIDHTIENQSQVYFPEWVYNRVVNQGREISLEIEEDGDEEIANKLAIVGLWCIQWNPTDRPSMTMVMQMLEGDLQSLEMPPKPFISSDVEMVENS